MNDAEFAKRTPSMVLFVDSQGVALGRNGSALMRGDQMLRAYPSLGRALKDGEPGSVSDEIKFRRLRPYIEGSLHKDWKGKIQWDMGKAEDDNELAIKDAYMQYKGIPNTKISVGSANFPFSREFLTSSKKQQLVERTFVGDHDYGTPDRNTGIHVTGAFLDKRLSYGVSYAAASLDPDSTKLDFDNPVNRNDDFNEGWMFGGRIDVHPLGQVKFSQGDFDRDFKFAIGLAGFAWANDEDNNTFTDIDNNDTSAGDKPDVDNVSGVELSAAIRGAGFSLDVQQNAFVAETVDPTVTANLYQDGELEMVQTSIEGGYMVWPGKLELVAGQSAQDADAYAEVWTRSAFGINFFQHKHDIKYQLTYRQNQNKDGIEDNDVNEYFLQSQFVF